MAEPLYDPSKEVLARGRDGSLRAVPKSDVAQLEQSGGQVLDANAAQAAVREARRYEESQTLEGQARTVSGAIVSGGLSPFAALAGGTGEQATAALFSDSPEEMFGIERQMRFDAEANPTLQFVGSTLGTGAVAAAGGAGVGAVGSRLAGALGAEAAAANLAAGGTLSQLAGRAVTAAPGAAGFLAENTLGGIGAANEQAFLENRELSAEEVAGAGLIGAGLGVGVGAAARGLGYAGSKAASKLGQMVPEGALTNIADRASYEAATQGVSKGVMRGVKDEAASNAIGRRLLDEGITEVASKQGSGPALELIKSRMASRGEVFERTLKEASEHIDGDALRGKVAAQAEELRSIGTTSATRLARKVERELEPLLKRIDAGEQVSFESVRKARTSLRNLGKQAGRGGDDAASQAWDKLYGNLTDTLDDAVTKAGEKAGPDSTLFADWKGANKAYGELAQAKKAFSAKLAAEQAPKPVLSFGDQNIGQGAAVLGSILTGNAGTGALIGLGTGIARKVVREKGAGWIARAADHLAQRGEIPSVTKLLAASSAARRELGRFAVGQMAQKGARAVAESEPAGFAYGALANYTNPKQVSDHYAEASRYLDASNGDPQGMAERANQHIGGLAQEQPELALAAQMKMASAVDYLRDTQPQPMQRSVLAVAAGNQSARQPPTHAQVAWLKRFRATVDPSVIYGEIARGYVNPETVQTLQTLYPSYLADVQQSVLGTLNETKPDLPYSQRLALDNLFGGNGMVEPTRRLSVQERLEQANQDAMQATTPAPQSRKAPEIAKFDVTTSDRLMST